MSKSFDSSLPKPMEWDFYERGSAGDATTSSQSRIIIEGDHSITPMEIFVREVLQNSLDAALSPNAAVHVHFKFHRLSQDKVKKSFLSAIGWKQLGQHVGAANMLRRERGEHVEFGEPRELQARDITVLEIIENGTIGLCGRERITSLAEERRVEGAPPNAYVALAREDGRREKQGLGSGGTYGLGKAVLWAASNVQTVIFFSRLSQSWDGTTHRLAGQSRLSSHYLEDGGYRGLGYAGEMADGWCRPVRDEEACSFMRSLGFGNRKDDQDAGTSILIPFWLAPEGDQPDVSDHILLARYAARFFWPAITETRLKVTTEDADGANDNAENHLVHYQPYIDLYKRVRSGESIEEDAPVRQIGVGVPAGPPPLDQDASETTVLAGMTALCDGQGILEKFKRKVACIRGQGMVVGYTRMTGNTLVKPFIGLALGGRSADSSEAGRRGDMLLGYSEYVTHTRWDDRSAVLKHWPGARPVIRTLLDNLRAYFEEFSRHEIEKTSSDTSALEQGLRFPGTKGRGPVPPHPDGQPVLKLGDFSAINESYRFDVKARIAKQNKPCQINVWVEAGRETTRRSDRVALNKDSITTTPHGLSVEVAKEVVKVAIPEYKKDMQITIRGRTAGIGSDMFAYVQGALRARVVKLGPATEDNEEEAYDAES